MATATGRADSPLTDIESSASNTRHHSPAHESTSTFEFLQVVDDGPYPVDYQDVVLVHAPELMSANTPEAMSAHAPAPELMSAQAHTHEVMSTHSPPMQGVEIPQGPTQTHAQPQTFDANARSRSPIETLQLRFLDALHYLELATIDLQDFSDIHGEPGDDAFQPPQFRSQDHQERLEHLRTERSIREMDVYRAAAQLTRHSDFIADDDVTQAPSVFPWRQHVPWRPHMRALRYTQRFLLEHAHATLLVLRYIGAEIHGCRSDVNRL